jgi:hypothetical protein
MLLKVAEVENSVEWDTKIITKWQTADGHSPCGGTMRYKGKQPETSRQDSQEHQEDSIRVPHKDELLQHQSARFMGVLGYTSKE